MQLNEFKNLVIDWDMSPEDAVTLYLEWGNNSWHARHQPVRSKSDFAVYFLVDNWGETPVVRLIRRNSDEAQELVSFDLPQHLVERFREEWGTLKGVYEPPESVKAWLKSQLEN